MTFLVYSQITEGILRGPNALSSNGSQTALSGDLHKKERQVCSSSVFTPISPA